MSLEAAIEKNTAAVSKLLELLTAAAALGSAGAVVGAQAQPVVVPALAPVPAPTPAAAPAAAPAQPAALVFSDLETRFRGLVAKNRPAAVKLLSDLGVAKLSLATLQQYPSIDAALRAAGA